MSNQINSKQFQKNSTDDIFGLSFDMMNCLCLCWHLSSVNNDITTTGALFPWRHSHHSHRDYAPSNGSHDVTFKVVILNVSLTHTVHSGKARGERRESVSTNGLVVSKRKRQIVLLDYRQWWRGSRQMSVVSSVLLTSNWVLIWPRSLSFINELWHSVKKDLGMGSLTNQNKSLY